MDLIAARDKKKKNLNLDNSNNSPKERTFFKKTYKRRRVPRVVMPEELIWEILLRLPPKSLTRFKSVCRAWSAIISSPQFISMHLRHSTSRNEPSFLIAPHTYCVMPDDKSMPTTWSPDKVAFYHWQEEEDGRQQGNAAATCLVHTVDLHEKSGFAYWPSHCDGLVLLPTDANLYVFNPGTGDFLILPEGQKSMRFAQATGLGLDLGTSTYKVAHFFYRWIDYYDWTYDAGMEVFTLSGGCSCWRTVQDPPYPVIMPQEPAYFKGSLYWHIDRKLLQTPLQGFIRLDLEEENFDFIYHPVLPSDERHLDFTELGGELCLVQHLPTEIVFWTSSSSSPSGGGGGGGDDHDHQWHRVYVINNNLAKVGCKVLRFLGDDCVFLQSGTSIYRHDKATGTAKEVASVDQLRYKNPTTGNLDFVGKDRYFVFIIPYTQSLVPLLPRAR